MSDLKAILVGQPNSGKSAIFRILSDIKSPGSSGPTVDVYSTTLDLQGNTLNLTDLPGVYSLNPTQLAEELTLNYIIDNKIDFIINVVDASLLTRSLELTVELIELGIPIVVALNLVDIAEKQGQKIDLDKLSKELGVPVVATQAIYGKGAKELITACAKLISNKTKSPKSLPFTKHLEYKISLLVEELKSQNFKSHLSPRFIALKSIENPNSIPDNLTSSIIEKANQYGKIIADEHDRDAFESISYERHHHSMSIAERTTIFQKSRKTPFIEKFDNWLLHPIAGYLFLVLFFFLYFFSIFKIGNFLSGLTEYPLAQLALYFEPLKQVNMFLWFSVNGAFLGFSGVTGIVLPYFLPLLFLTTIYEESGYLARVAFLVDGLMHRIGLHGKSVVPFILGFGCSIPAIYATRMIENKRDRMITSILIPFVPCSARIAVIFALTSAFAGPFWAFIIFAYVLFVIGLHGKILSRFQTKPIGLILEIPRLRTPEIKITLLKTWGKIYDFLKEAAVYLVLGSIVLGWIEFFNASKYINQLFHPLMEHLLGLPQELGSTLVFGFIRKELILVMATQSMNVQFLHQLPMTNAQVIVFIVFVTFYLPCFTTFIVLLKEFKWKVMTLSAILSLVVATLSALLFKLVLAQL